MKQTAKLLQAERSTLQANDINGHTRVFADCRARILSDYRPLLFSRLDYAQVCTFLAWTSNFNFKMAPSERMRTKEGSHTQEYQVNCWIQRKSSCSAGFIHSSVTDFADLLGHVFWPSQFRTRARGRSMPAWGI